jgi:hypothetical protein
MTAYGTAVKDGSSCNVSKRVASVTLSRYPTLSSAPNALECTQVNFRNSRTADDGQPSSTDLREGKRTLCDVGV